MQKLFVELKKNRPVIQSTFDFLYHCKPRTLKGIKLFVRYGDPDLSNLKNINIRKYSSVGNKDNNALKFLELVDPLNHIMSSNQSSTRGQKWVSISILDIRLSTINTTNTKTTKNSGPYSCNFQQKLINGGIYLDKYKYLNSQVLPKPDN